MKVVLHENNWTPIVKDVDWKNITQEEANELAKLLLTNTMFVVKKQPLTPADEIKICSMFGAIETYTEDTIRKHFILKDANNSILRVTGEKDEHGEPGMFGHVTELEWHANRVTMPNRKPIIWLYGERGTKGSRTSYINFQLIYNDLTEQQKKEFENLELDVGNNAFGSYYHDGMANYRGIYYPKMIHTNKLGRKSMFMPFNQVHFIKDWDQASSRKFIESLRDDLILNEKYVYHHDWDDGDIVVAEQWSGIHKRWEFKDMDKRVLHRIATDFSNTPYA